MERKLAQAEAELAKFKASQAEMERKEEAYLTTMEQMKDKVDRTLKTWMESDSIQVDKIQETLDQLPEEYQPAVRKEDFSLIPTELGLKKCLLKDLPSSVESEVEVEPIATIHEEHPKDHPQQYQIVQAYCNTLM